MKFLKTLITIVFISFAFIDKLNVETKTIVIKDFNNFIIILLLLLY